LGYSQLLRGNTEKAIKAFKHAIRLNKENKRYHNNLALAYIMNDKYELAAEQFRIVDNNSDAKAKMARLMNNLGKSKSNLDMDELFEDKKDTRVAVTESKPESPTAVNKDIDPVSLDAKTDPFASADAEKTVEKSAGKKLMVTSPSKIISIPSLEEDSEDGESHMTAVVVDTPSASDKNRSTFKSVPWEQSEAEKAETSLSLLSQTPSSDPAIQALHVSAVQIASGKVDKPIEAEPIKPTAIEKPNIQAELKPTSQPKIIEVAQIEALAPLQKQLYAVKPVTAVVRVQAHGPASSVGVVTPAHMASMRAGSDKSDKNVIYVAAAKPQKNISTVAPPKTELPHQNIEVELEIANGNGVNGMARKVAKYLEIRGFKIAEIKNAHSMDHLYTKVLFSSGGKGDLDRLLDELTVIKDVSNMIELEDLGKRIRVVVGKDLLSLEAKLSSTSRGSN
jgi:hypothetical protein